MESPRSMRLLGTIQGHDMLILVDLGSSHNFLSTTLASKLLGVSQLHEPLIVKVANRTPMSCGTHILQADWEVQGAKFKSDFKILSLQNFDLILGYDWLELYNPMKVHWSEKWLSIPYGSSSIVFHGMLSHLAAGSLVQVCAITDEELSLSVEEAPSPVIPVEIQGLLDKYAEVFATKVEYPPPLPRACCHTIPLVPGGTPVSVRPYRYSPALKDEIKSPVKDMLQAGLIQHIQSLFSAPIILVKKRDNSYRFCVDYHHLNAITVKRKYH
jgi:hypothetical protein